MRHLRIIAQNCAELRRIARRTQIIGGDEAAAASLEGVEDLRRRRRRFVRRRNLGGLRAGLLAEQQPGGEGFELGVFDLAGAVGIGLLEHSAEVGVGDHDAALAEGGLQLGVGDGAAAVSVKGTEGAAEAQPLLARQAAVAHLALRIGGDGLEQQLGLGLALVVQQGRELVRELFELGEGQAAVA